MKSPMRELVYVNKAEVDALRADNRWLRDKLHDIISLDHHNHGPESRATQIARDALNATARATHWMPLPEPPK
jgi:hypothetical protein